MDCLPGKGNTLIYNPIESIEVETIKLLFTPLKCRKHCLDSRDDFKDTNISIEQTSLLKDCTTETRTNQVDHCYTVAHTCLMYMTLYFLLYEPGVGISKGRKCCDLVNAS